MFGFEQEKELVERHNAWLNDELTAKVDSVIELRRKSNDLEDDMSTKLADVRMPLQSIFFGLWVKHLSLFLNYNIIALPVLNLLLMLLG